MNFAHDVGAGPADLYSDLSSNSPLDGPRVLCTAMFSKIFFIDSTDCRVSALSSFIFQDGCKPTLRLAGNHMGVRRQQQRLHQRL